MPRRKKPWPNERIAKLGNRSISVRIIDRGRGPEIEGTRVTVYRIMDYLREDSSAERIGQELELTAEQVNQAITYITAHRHEVEVAYEKILQRVNQDNPSGAEGKAPSAEELKQRILARQAKTYIHVDSARQ
jgi:uncharacterized protein (DUF433 family)